MRTLRWTVMAVTLILGVQAGPVVAAGAENQRPQFRQHMQEVMAMRAAARSFFEAKSAGNQETALAAAKKAQGLWQDLPEGWRKRIEEKHAGTADRIKGLHTEYALPDDYSPAGGGTTTTSGTQTRDGSTVTRESETTLPNGKEITRESTTTRNGNTVTRDAERTGVNGKTETAEATWTKNGNTVTKDATFTGPNGKQSEQDVTWTKTGNEVTREGTTTLPNGKTATSEGTWTKNGNTVTHEGETTLPNGKEITRESTTTRAGNTVTHQGTNTGARKAGGREWKPRYGDDFDLFGGRERPHAGGHGGRR